MTNTPLISVVIPVYNVEKYIEECLESVINQTYHNIEVILMDDGSTDGSARICKTYTQKDMRVHFYQQENKGVAAARKNASKYITGEYVIFVDSDDFLERDFFEEIFKKNQHCDLVTSGYYNGYGTDIRCFGAIEPGCYDTEQKLEYIYENFMFHNNSRQVGIHRNIWAKIFKKELVDEVFKEVDESLFFGEDAEFVYRYILKCKSVQITRICGYHYRMRDNSAVHSVNKKFLRNVDSIYNALEPVFSSHLHSEVLIPQLQKWIGEMISQSAYYLGFPLELQSTPYVFPNLKDIMGKDIVLYGAGNVGRSYKLFFERYHICNVKLWVDRKSEVYKSYYNVSDIQEIVNCEYDYLIIATKSQGLAEDIERQLIERGVENRKIMWDIPLEN